MWTKILLYGNKSPLHPIYSSHQGALVPLSQYLFTCLLIRLFILTIRHSYGQPRVHMGQSSGYPIAYPICSCPRQEICGWTGFKYASQNLARYVDITPVTRSRYMWPSTQNLDVQWMNEWMMGSPNCHDNDGDGGVSSKTGEWQKALEPPGSKSSPGAYMICCILACSTQPEWEYKSYVKKSFGQTWNMRFKVQTSLVYSFDVMY